LGQPAEAVFPHQHRSVAPLNHRDEDNPVGHDRLGDPPSAAWGESGAGIARVLGGECRHPHHVADTPRGGVMAKTLGSWLRMRMRTHAPRSQSRRRASSSGRRLGKDLRYALDHGESPPRWRQRPRGGSRSAGDQTLQQGQGRRTEHALPLLRRRSPTSSRTADVPHCAGAMPTTGLPATMMPVPTRRHARTSSCAPAF
jgi:hypothetical protein